MCCVCAHQVEKLPPSSPDFNPIENVWFLLDKRLKETDPGKLEKLADLKVRVGNAVRWLNANGQQGLRNCVESMQRRLQTAIRLKGAGTGC